MGGIPLPALLGATTLPDVAFGTAQKMRALQQQKLLNQIQQAQAGIAPQLAQAQLQQAQLVPGLTQAQIEKTQAEASVTPTAALSAAQLKQAQTQKALAETGVIPGVGAADIALKQAQAKKAGAEAQYKTMQSKGGVVDLKGEPRKAFEFLKMSKSDDPDIKALGVQGLKKMAEDLRNAETKGKTVLEKKRASLAGINLKLAQLKQHVKSGQHKATPESGGELSADQHTLHNTNISAKTLAENPQKAVELVDNETRHETNLMNEKTSDQIISDQDQIKALEQQRIETLSDIANTVSDPEQRAGAIAFGNLLQEMIKVDFAPVATFAGADGYARLQVEKSKMALNQNPSEAYRKFLLFKNQQVPKMVDEVRKALATSVRLGYIDKMLVPLFEKKLGEFSSIGEIDTSQALTAWNWIKDNITDSYENKINAVKKGIGGEIARSGPLIAKAKVPVVLQDAAQQTAPPTQKDFESTAKKYGMTVEQVKQRLGG